MKLEKKKKSKRKKVLHKQKSASLNSVPELIEIESWMLLNFFISMKFYIFHCHVCLNVCLSTYVWVSIKKKKKTFMAPFYGWGITASSLEPLRGGSLLFSTKSPEIPGTHFIDLGGMKGWVDLEDTQWFWTREPWIGNPAP